MLVIVTCNQCGESGHFRVYFEVIHGVDVCDACGDHKDRKWKFNFCTQDCFVAWFNAHAVGERGVPCQHCVDHKTGQSSGFAHGFPENGTCKTCEGTKYVKP